MEQISIFYFWWWIPLTILHPLIVNRMPFYSNSTNHECIGWIFFLYAFEKNITIKTTKIKIPLLGIKIFMKRTKKDKKLPMCVCNINNTNHNPVIYNICLCWGVRLCWCYGCVCWVCWFILKISTMMIPSSNKSLISQDVGYGMKMSAKNALKGIISMRRWSAPWSTHNAWFLILI